MVYAARNALAPLNISVTMTLESFIVQPVMSLSKACACYNMYFMSVTAATFQALRSWLKAAATWNT